MSDFVFHDLEEADLHELLSWHQDAELAHRYGGTEWPLKLWKIIQEDENRQCRVVTQDTKLIGYIDIEMHPKEHLMWIGLAVKPEMRKQGFGKRILEQFLATPFSWEFKEIWAGIEQDNIASRKCFESVGFVAKNPEGDTEGIIDYVVVK